MAHAPAREIPRLNLPTKPAPELGQIIAVINRWADAVQTTLTQHGTSTAVANRTANAAQATATQASNSFNGGDVSINALGTATATQNYDSHVLSFHGSLWNGTDPGDDSWKLQVTESGSALNDGSDLQLNHSSISGGAGRWHVNSDSIIGPPGSATASANFNSFAFDLEGSYWDGATQFMLWEYSNSTTPSSGNSALNARFNLYPIWTGTIQPSYTADFSIGGTGVNPAVGNPVAHPYWVLKAYPVSDGHTATLQHTAFTADRTITFPDGDSNTIQPLTSGAAHKWLTHIDASGTQSLSQPAASDLSDGTTGSGAVVLANSPLFAAKVTVPALVSASANPATVGTVELAVSDVIAWRNNANSGNLRLGVDAGDNLELVGGFNGINFKGNNLSQVTNIQSDSANIAASGFILMSATDEIAWRNAANTGDLFLAKDASDRLTFGGNTVAAPVYNAAGTLQNSAHIVQDTVTLSGGTATVTLSGSAAFSSATSYTCTANDQTATNPVKVTQNSGSSITFTGTGTDVIRYIAVGN